MMKTYFQIILFFFCFNSFSQDSLSLIFIGDIMGHDSQIAAAIDSKSGEYNYNGVFEKLSPILKSVDFSIANLEVTLAGPPFKGYPQFSSPDELAAACQENGINILVTSNNHSCDRRKQGIVRTIDVLDSLNIPHTGTFKNQQDRDQQNLLLLEKNNIKVGILNYTYGTNGIPTPFPTIVNRIDTTQMSLDIKNSKASHLDKLIVFIHWGKEYQSHPSNEQEALALFLFNKGVDIIIGSHPHVLQRMEYDDKKDKFIVYSLGNFVSNQRDRYRDGGAMTKLILVKNESKTQIAKSGYYLTWVNKPFINGSRKFEILPCYQFEDNKTEYLNQDTYEKMKLFIDDSRKLFDDVNLNVSELKTF